MALVLSHCDIVVTPLIFGAAATRHGANVFWPLLGSMLRVLLCHSHLEWKSLVFVPASVVFAAVLLAGHDMRIMSLSCCVEPLMRDTEKAGVLVVVVVIPLLLRAKHLNVLKVASTAVE